MDDKLSDFYIAKFSRHIDTWELISPFLGFTNADEVALKRNHPDYYQQKKELLFLWRRRRGSGATWRVLAEACKEAGEINLVEKIYEMFGQRPPLVDAPLEQRSQQRPLERVTGNSDVASFPAGRDQSFAYDEAIEAQNQDITRPPQIATDYISTSSSHTNTSQANNTTTVTAPNISSTTTTTGAGGPSYANNIGATNVPSTGPNISGHYALTTGPYAPTTGPNIGGPYVPTFKASNLPTIGPNVAPTPYSHNVTTPIAGPNVTVHPTANISASYATPNSASIGPSTNSSGRFNTGTSAPVLPSFGELNSAPIDPYSTTSTYSEYTSSLQLHQHPINIASHEASSVDHSFSSSNQPGTIPPSSYTDNAFTTTNIPSSAATSTPYTNIPSSIPNITPSTSIPLSTTSAINYPTAITPAHSITNSDLSSGITPTDDTMSSSVSSPNSSYMEKESYQIITGRPQTFITNQYIPQGNETATAMTTTNTGSSLNTAPTSLHTNPPTYTSTVPSLPHHGATSTIYQPLDLSKLYSKLYNKYSAHINSNIPEVIDYANRLKSESIIDDTVVTTIVTTLGMSLIHQVTLISTKIDSILATTQYPVDVFVKLCMILQLYTGTKDIAEAMMREAGLQWPVQQQPAVRPIQRPHDHTVFQPHIAISRDVPPPSLQSTSTHLSSSSITHQSFIEEEPPIDYSKYSDVSKYGKPTLREMLNWIVAEEPSIWNEVGAELGISDGRLKGILMNHSLGGNPKLMFKEVLAYWERSHCRPFNWGTILDVLSSDYVNHEGLARKVAEKLDSKARR